MIQPPYLVSQDPKQGCPASFRPRGAKQIVSMARHNQPPKKKQTTIVLAAMDYAWPCHTQQMRRKSDLEKNKSSGQNPSFPHTTACSSAMVMIMFLSSDAPWMKTTRCKQSSPKSLGALEIRTDRTSTIVLCLPQVKSFPPPNTCL